MSFLSKVFFCLGTPHNAIADNRSIRPDSRPHCQSTGNAGKNSIGKYTGNNATSNNQEKGWKMKSYRTIELFEEAVQNDCVMLTRVYVYHGIKLDGKEFESAIHMARVHYHTIDSTEYAYVTINGHDDERQFFKFIDKLNTFIVPPVEFEFE